MMGNYSERQAHRHPNRDQAGHAGHGGCPLPGRGAARHRRRCALRLRRRPAGDQRARQLPAEHHHPHPGGQRRRHRRVRDRAPGGHRLRRHRAGAAVGDHGDGRRRLRAALRPEHLPHRHDGRQGRRHGPAGRRQHHHPAARPQSLPAERLHARRRVRTVARAEDPRSDPGRPARAPLHQARDLRALRQPGAAARRLRRGGRRADVLQQVGQGRHARRGGHHRRHHPDARAPQPVRQSGTHAGPAQQLRAAAHGRGRVRHPAGGRGGREETDRAPRPGHHGALVRRLLRRRHPQEPRAALRRGGAVRDRPAGADDARHRSAARRRARRGPRAAARRQAPRRSIASRRQTVRAANATPETFTSSRWSRTMAAGRHRPGGGDGAAQDPGRTGAHPDRGGRSRSAPQRLRVDPEDGRRGPLRRGRRHRSGNRRDREGPVHRRDAGAGAGGRRAR